MEAGWASKGVCGPTNFIAQLESFAIADPHGVLCDFDRTSALRTISARLLLAAGGPAVVARLPVPGGGWGYLY